MTTSTKKKVVIALGGNALGKDIVEQRKIVKDTSKAIVDLIVAGCEVVVTHGNGPQVGTINNAMSEFYDNHKAKGMAAPIPLDTCGAMSQAYIGYDLQNALREECLNRNVPINGVATVITMTEVDKDDIAFQKPTKPIGPFMTKEQAEECAKTLGWDIVEDCGRGYRRVVASPFPKKIVEIEAIKGLIKNNSLCICSGGGGIPVFKEGNSYVGAPAVIDKDNAASLLARELDVDVFIILTAVEKIALNFNKPNQTFIDRMSVTEAKKYCEEGHFAPGSMLPKVKAAIAYAESKKGRQALVTLLEKAEEAIKGTTGTVIYNDSE